MEIGRGGKTLVLLAAFVVVCAGLKSAASLLNPLLLAAFLTSISTPVMGWMRRKGFPTWVAGLSVIIINLATLAAIAALLGTSLRLFLKQLPAYQAELELLVRDAGQWLVGFGLSAEELRELLPISRLMGWTGTILSALVNVVSSLVLVFIIVTFMLAEAAGVRIKLTRLITSDETFSRFSRATTQVNRYLLVKSATSAATGLLIGGWVAVLGLDFPVLWGFLAFLLNYIPTLGSIIASVPALLLSLIQLGPGPTLLVLIGYLAVNFSIGNFLEPRVFGRALGISPLVVFLSMLFWGWLLGPLGAFLSVPLTMILKIYLMNTNDLNWVAVLLAPARQVAEDRRSFPITVPGSIAAVDDGK